MNLINVVCDVLIVLISAFAIIQYLLNKRNILKTAATLVYNQLKGFDTHIESVAKLFDENGNISDYHLSVLNSLFEENQWEKGKHILVKRLNQDDIALIDSVYDQAESIEVARKRIIQTYMATNDAKSYALQFQIIQHIVNEAGQNRMNDLTTKFNNANYRFSMKIPHDVFKNQVMSYTRISGTKTLEKLYLLSYKNKR